VPKTGKWGLARCLPEIEGAQWFWGISGVGAVHVASRMQPALREFTPRTPLH
jgi:hypothetical protein